mgnify:CR=1 FL=1
MNQVTKDTKNQEYEFSSNVLFNIVQPLGIYTNQLDEQFLIIERNQSKSTKPIIIPTTLLAHGRDHALSEHLIKNGVTEILFFKSEEIPYSVHEFL